MNASSSSSAITTQSTSEGRIQSARSPTEQRILSLLGAGTPHSVVAAATGTSESYISQLLSDDTFKGEVLELKFKSLSAHNERDSKYDSLEDKLGKQLERNLPLLQKPMEILKALQVVNGLKRRGVSQDSQVTQQQTVVELLIPDKVVQHFQLNVNNQVINVGSQTLETMQSHTLLSTVKNGGEIPQLESRNENFLKSGELSRLIEHSNAQDSSRTEQRKSSKDFVGTIQEVFEACPVPPRD